MPQTTVQLTQNLAFEGQILTNQFGSIRGQALRPYFNATTGTLSYGRAVVLASGSLTNVIVPATTGQTPVGITIFNDFDNEVLIDNLAFQGYRAYSEVSVLVKGGIDVVVWSEAATNYDDPVYFRYAGADNVTTFLGRFTNTATSNFTQYVGARFVWKTTGAGLSVVNIGGF